MKPKNINFTQKHYDMCPVCKKTGNNLSAQGASGRSAIIINGKEFINEDMSEYLYGFHYDCVNCNISFTAKNHLPNNSSEFFTYRVVTCKDDLNALKEKTEKIICAAIWFDDEDPYYNPHSRPKNIDTGFVICGIRHCNCLGIYQAIAKESAPKSGVPQIQGFITTQNRFVDRVEACKIAIKAGQVNNKKDGDDLFSEDLY